MDTYKINYKVIGPHYKSMLKKAYGLIETDYRLLKIARNFKPDILVGRGSVYLAHLSILINKPYIAYVDTENANLAAWLTFPFADVIITPSSFKKKMNPKKHIKINSYKEIAYLHPNYFKPNPEVLNELNLCKNDKFIFLRFVAWGASHDLGHSGISNALKKEYLLNLEKYGRVFISSESELTTEYIKYRINIPSEKFHSLLSYAQLYIGEGGSTATEAAILGTPSIHISTTAKFCGVFDDLSKYNLIYTFDDDHKALEKAIEILNEPKSKEKWIQRKDAMLREKKDVTKFITELIEGYPESFYRLKKE